jgi:DDE superfamily endonuclease
MASVRFADMQSRPVEFLDFTSLTLDEFQQLVPPFEAAFQAHMAAWRLDGKPRTARQFAVYKNCPLPTPEDRLFFILAYVKTYSLQVVQGRLFGMGQSKANQWIHVLLPALLAALRTLGDAPACSLTALAQRLGVSEADAATVVAPLEEAPAPVASIPAAAPVSPLLPMTERRIVRPQDPAAQTECYSGKKKDHTVKNVLLVNALLMILFLSDTYGGRVHDKRIADATPYPLPARSRLLQDLGFLAFTLPQVEILMPTKKPRGQELSLEEQHANQALNQRRLRIEHINSSVKRCRIVKDRIRLWKQGVRDLVMELCCALHNFRVRLTPWQPMV